MIIDAGRLASTVSASEQMIPAAVMLTSAASAGWRDMPASFAPERRTYRPRIICQGQALGQAMTLQRRLWRSQ